VCNYNFGNLIDSAIFPIGETGSECVTGTHKKYPGLCSSKEIFETPKSPNQKKEQKEQNEKFNGKIKVKDDDRKEVPEKRNENSNVKYTVKEDKFESFQEIPKQQKKEKTRTHSKISFDDFDFGFFESFKAGANEDVDVEKDDGKTRVRYHVRYH
jgi:hypothetical protein